MEKTKSRKVSSAGEADTQPAGGKRVGQLRDELIETYKIAFIDDDGSFVEPAPQVSRIIDEMVETGFFGDSQALCVERILCRWIIENAGLLTLLGVRIPRIVTTKAGVQSDKPVKP